MAPPTTQEITAATTALRNEAGVWDTESTELGKISPAVEALRLPRVEAGLFQVVFSAYEEVVNQVIARAGEGTTATQDVADTLRSVADTYDREEAANVHKMKNIY